MQGPLSQQRDETASVDPWLPLLLGLVSLTQHVDAWLEKAAATRSEHVAPDDDAALAILLGVASLRIRFLAHLDGMAVRATDAPDQKTSSEALGSSLLR